jgi:hypothetical protein
MESDLFVSAKKNLEFSRSCIFFACLFYNLDSCNDAEEFMKMKQLGENTNVACGSWCLEKNMGVFSGTIQEQEEKLKQLTSSLCGILSLYQGLCKLKNVSLSLTHSVSVSLCISFSCYSFSMMIFLMF